MNRHEHNEPRKTGREADRQRKVTLILVLVATFLAGVLVTTVVGRIVGWPGDAVQAVPARIGDNSGRTVLPPLTVDIY